MKLIDYIVKKGFNRLQAKTLIKDNKVSVNGIKSFDEKLEIQNYDQIAIEPKKLWVSRGAYKLIEAINEFKLILKNKVVLDIGASTGGFTDVSLKYGAKKVYALDVGKNQLDYQLRINPKVIVYEKTNLKAINQNMFKEKIDVVSCDVSFISLINVFKVLANIKHKELKIVVLIKPQFEAFKDQVEKGGYVNEKYHEQIIAKVNNFAKEYGFKMMKVIPSPIKGLKAKNIEYLGYYGV